jgi:integral membrane protein (TIGR00529 family)
MAFLSKIPLGDINKFQLYCPVFMLLVGWFVAFKGVPKVIKKKEEDKLKKRHIIALIEGLFPILFLILSVLFLKLHLIIALIIVIVALFFIYRFSFRQILGFLKEAFNLQIVLLIFGVMYFKNMLDASGSITSMVKFFTIIKLNKLIILFSMPFIVGVLTGVVQAFVGITFPLLLPFVTVNGVVDLPLLSFAFISGYAGVMLSPVHLCYLLSCEYFKVEITEVYPYLLILIPFLPLIGLLLIIFR